ncbi:prolyl oligopeptidase family serine peptidase [bacterium]|nr:prolyl oligopeptidase family serine peptidase [bacterium]
MCKASFIKSHHYGCDNPFSKISVAIVVLIISTALSVPAFSQELPKGYHIETLPDSNLVLVENELDYSLQRPLLIVLHCEGGTAQDIYDNIAVAESLGWMLAVAKGPRNHRSTLLNTNDILNLADYLKEAYPVDPDKIFIFGFSGMGAQALYTVFDYPHLFAGAVSTCGHSGGLTNIQWDKAKNVCVYLITRQKDWNRQQNETMSRLFDSLDIRFRLEITPGEHEEGPPEECYRACEWLNAVSSMDWR